MSAGGAHEKRRVFRLPLTGARVRADVDDELRFHLEGRVEELMARGLDRETATAEARRRFGDVEGYRREAARIDERTVQERRLRYYLAAFGRELRLAVRSLRRDRGFSLTAVATLALGLGAATAIFTMLDGIVLRPLPYAHAERLVQLTSPVPKFKGDTLWGIARHEAFYFMQHARSIQSIGVYATDEAIVGAAASGAPTERVPMVQASASLFDALGVRAELGRLLVPADNHAQLPTVVVLGHGYWERHFGGDRGVIGKVLDVEGFPMTIVGVAPPEAQLPEMKVDLWLPAYAYAEMPAFNNHTWGGIGRLRPGFTAADAQRELAPLTARLPTLFPNAEPADFVQSTGFHTQVRPLRDVVVGDTMMRALWILFAAVALVLLIATANLSNLFLVRAEARRRESAVRTALGAGRVHLAAQSMAESFLIAFVSGALAILLAWAMLKLLLAFAPEDLPRLEEIGLRWREIGFVAGGAVAVALFLGTIPLVTTPALDVVLLREGGRGMTTSRRRALVRGGLVVAQVALSLVLLTAAGLMLRTFQKLREVRPGFDPKGVLALNVSIPAGKYGRSESAASGFYEQLAKRVEALPDVRVVGFTEKLPLASGYLCTGVNIEGGGALIRGDCPPTALVSPGFFEAMGIGVDGRAFTWDDMDRFGGQMVVSRAFAERTWPGESAMNRGMRFQGNKPPWYRVSGVANDVLGAGLDQPPPAVVYFPLLPMPDAKLWGAPTFMHMVVRTTRGDPLKLVPRIQQIVAQIDAGAALGHPKTMESLVAASMARRTFTMLLLAIAASIALFLSIVGIYGVISYLVGQRRSEIAIRMALGAQMGRVRAMVVRQSLGLTALGVVVGIAAALVTTRVLRSLLFGVSPSDPALIAIAAATLLAVALLAGWVPARRAARVDPADAFRAG